MSFMVMLLKRATLLGTSELISCECEVIYKAFIMPQTWFIGPCHAMLISRLVNVSFCMLS